MKSDFSGYATRNDLRCTDGRIIRHDAFADCDGKKVPLVYQHDHSSPENVLGHAILENREDGVYCYGFFNDTQRGQNAKKAVEHGDITALSIYANHLRQDGPNVVHGNIREVSLVLAGANPGAFIENVAVAHSDDDGYDELEDQAIIYNDEDLFHGEELDLEDPEDEESDGEDEDEDVAHEDNDKGSDGDILDNIGLDKDQKDVVLGLIGLALDQGSKSASDEDDSESKDDTNDNSVAHSAEEGEPMPNIFEKNGAASATEGVVLSHEDQAAFLAAAEKDPSGSFRTYALRHAQDYGISNIEVLFPDAKMVSNEPDMYKRDTAWVATVLNGVHHLPFSRIKSIYIDLTEDEARAKGFTLDRNSNKRKKEEMVKAAKRVTTPTTVYKKQKLDRDDVTDITEFSVVNWMMREMRIMLDEEIARAILIGDGREISDDDHINEESIRPVINDDDLYVIRTTGQNTETNTELVDRIRASKTDYMGSGNLTAFISPQLHAELMVQRDQLNHRMYATDAELAAELGVSRIVEVPIMTGLKDDDQKDVLAAILDLSDYDTGTDRGGQITSFNDFDIDYNQHKYLMETRMSGALVRPKSAIVVRRNPKA